MLVEFSVENYRSFQEKQTFSMVASDDETMQETNTFPMPNTKDLRLLKSAAIYGLNASGKSNLIQAIKTLINLVVNSASKMQIGEELPVEPFKLNIESAKQPTVFEVIFIHQYTRYQYGVSLNKERILEEWLIAYPNERQQNWFSREYIPENPELQADEGYKWSFGRGLKGEKGRIKKFVRSNSLFLSHAAQNNHPQITEIFEWFQNNLKIMDLKTPDTPLTLRECLSNQEFRKKVVEIIKQADIGISDIEIQIIRNKNFLDILLNDNLNDKKIARLGSIYDFKIITIHKINDSDSQIGFDMNDESNGTKRLFEIAGYWLIVLESSKVLFVDELERSLHPELSKALVKMFNDPEVNKNNAQLIFATHDTTLLDEEILRPDQIWLTDKDNSMTKLYSLLDFHVREDESLQKGYLLGRYGAIPYIKKLTI